MLTILTFENIKIKACYNLFMKKKKLEYNPEVQKRLKENQTIEKKSFTDLLRKAVKTSSKQSV